MSKDNGYPPEEMKEVAAADAQHQDVLTTMIREKVTQCASLLRQQLERKAKRQPEMYGPDHIDRIMREFEGASEDVQATITARVMSKLTDHVQKEVLRVLEDAIDDGAESFEAPLDNLNWVRPVVVSDGEAAQRLKGKERAAEETALEDLPTSAEGSLKEDKEGGVPTAYRLAEPTASEAGQGNHEAAEEFRPTSEAAPPTEANEENPDQTARSQHTAKKPLSEEDGEVYEGSVELRVESNESLRQVVKFVDALRRNPDFRLLQLVGNHHEGIGIWLGLRSPVRLKEILLEMAGVTQVDATDLLKRNGDGPLLNVKLTEPAFSS
ncbi:MAG: hypothetical protein ACE5JL_08015 [Dehalococcoidia bacterium]